MGAFGFALVLWFCFVVLVCVYLACELVVALFFDLLVGH